jgi:hypothetical protein
MRARHVGRSPDQAARVHQGLANGDAHCRPAKFGEADWRRPLWHSGGVARKETGLWLQLELALINP